MPDSDLTREKILELEFTYAKETAAQAQNDRTVVVNLYLFLVGGVGSLTLTLPQISETAVPIPRAGYGLIFGMLAVIGFFTVLKLVRLRQAWHDSVQTMNRIKDFYLIKFPEIASAFRWRTESIPAPGKPFTIYFNLALLVALVDSLMLAVAVNRFGARVALGEYVVETFAALLYLVWQMWFYFFQLPIGAKETK